MSEQLKNQQTSNVQIYVKAFARIRIVVIVLTVTLVVMTSIVVWMAFNYFKLQEYCDEVSSTTIYKLVLLDVYYHYSVALRDLQATYDLLVANYYSQYLEVPYNIRWIAEGMWRKPMVYLNDSLNMLDSTLERIKKIEWSRDLTNNVVQLQQYVYELKLLVLQMQQIINKDTYTEDDLVKARSIVENFASYNDKVFDLVMRSL